MEKKCPFCDKYIKPGNHIYKCCLNKNIFLERDFIKFKYIEYNFPYLAIEKNLKFLYVEKEKTLPELKKEYDISYKEVVFLLDFFSIKKRTIKESTNLKKTREKFKSTCIKKYGTENPLSKGTDPYKKRNKTVLKRYNVKNVFQLDEVKEKIWDDEKCINKWGLTRRELISKNSKEMWDKLNEDEREKRILYAIDESIKKRGYMSSLESSITKSFDRIGFSFVSQFFIKEPKRLFFDFLIRDLKILIEIQGDYWHANPSKYKKDDYISYPEKKILAEDIWKKDFNKKDIAEKKGYKVIYIWECELKKIKEDDKIDYLILKKILEALNENQIY
jgi:G:T-mismatch repair DNA endonuclease (very short patch repair protein)